MKKILIILIIIIVVLVLAYFTLFVWTKSVNYLPEIEGKTWVQIDPIQCLDNPWEVDWIKNHNGDASSYPRNYRPPDMDEAVVQIIKNYYQEQGIVVYDLKARKTYEDVCLACSCADGYTLYLLVSDTDVDKMLDLGYTLS